MPGEDAEDLDEKPVEVVDAEISEDGSLVIEFSEKIGPGFTHTKRAVFDPEMLFSLVQEYGEIPPKEATDFPGIPHVIYEAVFPEDDEDGMGEPDLDIEADPEAGDKEGE